MPTICSSYLGFHSRLAFSLALSMVNSIVHSISLEIVLGVLKRQIAFRLQCQCSHCHGSLTVAIINGMHSTDRSSTQIAIVGIIQSNARHQSCIWWRVLESVFEYTAVGVVKRLHSITLYRVMWSSIYSGFRCIAWRFQESTFYCTLLCMAKCALFRVA